MDRPDSSSTLAELLQQVGSHRSSVPTGDLFLSIVVRTQGQRPHLLAESLDCLAEQTDRDLEVVLVRHRADGAGRAAVAEVVAALPDWLRQRTRVLDLDTGARGAPLNAGFEAARGSYVVALDDDDLVMPEWVATFRSLHQHAPGRALRAGALRQDVEAVEEEGRLVARAVGAPYEHWPVDFELLDHLLVNQTPNMTIAFPRTVFHDFGERFDEELDTTEDWDFLLRAVTLVGVANSEEHTAIYRWWVGGESSQHLHDDIHWQHNHNLVQRRMDQRVMLMPHGTVQRLQELVELPRVDLARVVAERDDLAGRVEQLEQRVRRQEKRLRRLRSRQDEATGAPAAKPSTWRRLRR